MCKKYILLFCVIQCISLVGVLCSDESENTTAITNTAGTQYSTINLFTGTFETSFSEGQVVTYYEQTDDTENGFGPIPSEPEDNGETPETSGTISDGTNSVLRIIGTMSQCGSAEEVWTGDHDCFLFNTGNHDTFTFFLKWEEGSIDLDFRIYSYNGSFEWIPYAYGIAENRLYDSPEVISSPGSVLEYFFPTPLEKNTDYVAVVLGWECMSDGCEYTLDLMGH